MPVRVVRELHTRILEALLRYKFLTCSQLLLIGVSTSKQVIWRKLGDLRSWGLIETIPFEDSQRIGRISRTRKQEGASFLTRKGAEALAEINRVDFSEITYHPVTSAYHRDYLHRRYCIDFHILLNTALQEHYTDVLQVGTFDRYFDKTGANRTNDSSRGRLRANTRIDITDSFYMIPDLIFTINQTQDTSRRWLFCLEMENGTDTGRTLKKLVKHAYALEQGSVSEKYGFEVNHRVLLLFEDLGTMEAVRSRYPEIDRPGFLFNFWFAHLKQAYDDVLNCWKLADRDGVLNLLTGKKPKPSGENNASASN